MSKFLPLNYAANPFSNVTKGSPYGDLSFFAIPAVWVISISAHFYAASLTSGKFDNVSPRAYLASINGKQKKAAWEEKYIRAEAAQQNGFENIAFFAAAIIAGHVAKLPVDELNAAALGYVVSRIAYNLLYIFNTKESLSFLRTVAFLAGVGINFSLFIKAGYALQY